MSPYALSIIISSLATGTMLTLASNHWFMAWMGLELNTLAIIPLMTKTHHPRATEAATKYFLMQALASAMILFSSTMNAWFMGEWEITNMSHPISTTMLTIGLAMKLGIAPFHMWFPDVLQGLNLLTCLILSTWQKIAPMILMIQIYPQLNTNLLIVMAILSTTIGGWGGLNQTQLRKIMAYSSIAHLGWMTLVLCFMPSLTLLNLAVYMTMTTVMFLMFMNMMSTTINKMAMSWLKNPVMAASMMIVLMSLGGLPPTTGFMPKWLIIQEMTKQNLIAITTIIALSSLLSLFFYLRMSYSISLTTSPNISNTFSIWRQNNKNQMFLSMTIILSTLMLPITPTLINILN
ncbi:NADH dehydrogenase subunit 2 (mitochondrion) [Ambystoma mexicanum]|uniref:NADH-ubiquinone oxidoreductase chain 2 n=1 Tax=Ambystoma mexicanum TaxID=8296 RepID=Q70EE7_AMBME|nr:NADH dehydrogenase subunit 2 [Ambystoma mexicanum]AAT49198.1 NADH dehydrogenase subunit 2 [Ambystoma mexicanum]AGL76343.1 NADH dehydrogenase subunit 2 [Ambystoma mexicanum]CAE48091.1 NADH deydrogenase subunit 2 [Ambystoma mexicanum]